MADAQKEKKEKTPRERQLCTLMANTYGALASSMSRDLEKAMEPKGQRYAFAADPVGAIKKVVPTDEEYRERILWEIPAHDLREFAEIKMRQMLLYYATEGHYWKYQAGAERTRKAFKDVASRYMFVELKEKLWTDEQLEGTPMFKNFYMLLGAVQIDGAKAAAEAGYDYCARDLMHSAVFHLITELHLKPSDKFLKGDQLDYEAFAPGVGVGIVRGKERALSLTDLAAEPLDDEGERMKSALEKASFGEMCKMATELLSKLEPLGKFDSYLIGFAKENAALLGKKEIAITGKEQDYQKREQAEEFEFLSNDGAMDGVPELRELLKHIAADVLTDTPISGSDEKALHDMLEELMEGHERLHRTKEEEDELHRAK
jgi:hypothetical protein